MLLNCGAGEDSRESLGLQGDPTSQSLHQSIWCKEPTHWKQPWGWERLRAGEDEGDREWGGWMASPTQWTWIWASGGREWQGSLACCSLWGCKESDTTEQLNKNTDIEGEVESNTIIVRDFSISFTSMDKSFRRNKETQALNDTIDQLYWIE